MCVPTPDPTPASSLTVHEDHLRAQRDLSEHTVRGYVTDAVRLLERHPVDAVADHLDVSCRVHVA